MPAEVDIAVPKQDPTPPTKLSSLSPAPQPPSPSPSTFPSRTPSQSPSPTPSVTPPATPPSSNSGFRLRSYSAVDSAQASRFGPFKGLRELHMSRHDCFAFRPHGTADYRTCSFHNLFFDGAAYKPHSAHWLYFLAVPEGENVDNSVQRVRDELGAGMGVFSRRKNPAQMDFEIVAFWERDTGGTVPTPASWIAALAAATAAGDGSTAGPPDVWGSGGLLEERAAKGQAASLAHDCRLSSSFEESLSREADKPACLQPGVVAHASVPTFFQGRSAPQNLGHTIWDDLIPTFGALVDLGLESHLKELQLLTTDWEGHPGDLWPSRVTEEATRLHFPMHEPLHFRQFQDANRNRVVRVAHLLTGLMSRSPHDIQPNYASYGAERRLVWKYRERLLDAAGLTSQDNDWSAGVPTGQLRFVLLQKDDKRSITNLDALRAGLAAALQPLNADVRVLRWPELGGYRPEAAFSMQQHIIMGVDGTGANGLHLLPRGAVYISLGVRSATGEGSLSDFIFGGVDHIRVLYAHRHAPGGTHDPIEVNVDMAVSAAKEAVALVRRGFSVPVPFLHNHSPQGRVCHHLFARYPQLAERAYDMWIDGRVDMCRAMQLDAASIWRAYTPQVPVPTDLACQVALALQSIDPVPQGTPCS